MKKKGDSKIRYDDRQIKKPSHTLWHKTNPPHSWHNNMEGPMAQKLIIGAVAHPNNDTITKSELIELIAADKIFVVTSTIPLNFDFHDFIAETETAEETSRRHIAEKAEKVTDISEIIDFDPSTYTTLCQKDDSGYWAMTLQKISPIGVAYGINLHELLIQKYNNDHRSSGCTQPIVVSDDAWERITTGSDDVSLSLDADYYLSWHSQNEFYQSEPDEVIGYLPACSIYDLLDGCGDWLGEMTPDSPELEHGLSIDWNDDGGIDGWEVDDPSKFLEYILANWHFTDEIEGIREDVERFLTQKCS